MTKFFFRGVWVFAGPERWPRDEREGTSGHHSKGVNWKLQRRELYENYSPARGFTRVASQFQSLAGSLHCAQQTGMPPKELVVPLHQWCCVGGARHLPIPRGLARRVNCPGSSGVRERMAGQPTDSWLRQGERRRKDSSSGSLRTKQEKTLWDRQGPLF